MFSKSKLNDHWEMEGKTRIEVNGSPGVGGKIFGIPWLLFGVYFTYNWVIAGIIEYLKAGDYAGLISGAWIWLLLFAILFIIFVVPGWALAFMRRKVIVDVSRGEVEEANDFIVYRRPITHAISSFNMVLLVEIVSKSKDGKTRYFYDVRLVSQTKKDHVLVASFQEEDKAEEFGKTLSELTRLPFEIQDESERRRE